MEFCGYIKANKLTSEYIIRQDMEKREEAQIISIDDYKNGSIKLLKNDVTEQITIKDAFKIKENNVEINDDLKSSENNKTWVSITSKILDKQINVILRNYKTRTNLIDAIISKAIENDIKGVIIDFEQIQIEDEDIAKRFIIELTPKLREIGINTGAVLNSNVDKSNYIDLVDYIIEDSVK